VRERSRIVRTTRNTAAAISSRRGDLAGRALAGLPSDPISGRAVETLPALFREPGCGKRGAQDASRDGRDASPLGDDEEAYFARGLLAEEPAVTREEKPRRVSLSQKSRKEGGARARDRERERERESLARAAGFLRDRGRATLGRHNRIFMQAE